MKKHLTAIREHIVRLHRLGWLNKYTVALTVFLVWLAFFDRHNLIVQYKLYRNVQGLTREIEQYHVKIEDVAREKVILETEPERYARERYFMHKPDEEVFVIERK